MGDFQTIFEICGKNKSQEYLTMKQKRALHKETINAHHHLVNLKRAESDLLASNAQPTRLQGSNTEEINDVFGRVILPKKRKIEDLYRRDKKRKLKDDNYIPYVPTDQHTEQGLALNNFQKEASNAQLDLVGDSDKTLKMHRQSQMWDRKKKKMVAVPNAKAGKIKTESGAWIPATYKSNRYAQWKERTKAGENEEDDGDELTSQRELPNSRPNTHWARHNEKIKSKQRKSELKTTDQIVKARLIADKKKQRQKKGKRKGKPNKSKSRKKKF